MKVSWKMVLIIAIGLSILLLVGSLTGANQKLFNMALDQLRVDRSRVVEVQAENQKWYEEEMEKLAEERDQLREEKLSVQMEKAQIIAERDALKGWVNELQKKRQVIVVSDDPDRIIGDLHKLGISSIRRR
jgi:FMN phosphatase YigB (HAD superfamily)